jgi:anti-sigma regulatory factor (Ser/Thr protein kinase)
VPGRVAATVQLVVSDLVTNAGKYAPGPCLLTLGMVDGCVEVSVWDSSTTFPTVMPPDPARIGQHGLEIVMSVCSRFTVQSEPVGKRITAAVTLTGEPGAS